MIPVIDAHSDLFSKCVEEGLDWVDDSGEFQASAAHLERGGVRVQWASIYVPAQVSGADATHWGLRIVGAAHQSVRRMDGRARIVATPGALRDAWDRTAPLGFVLSMEGASPISGRVDLLDMFARLGMRALGLTHNHDNECGDGCFAKEPSGLTAAGRTLAREAEARGVILDAAHLNPVSFDQVMELASGPVIYSHGGSRDLVDVPRNLSDPQARAVAASGGVLGVDFFPGHVAEDGRHGTIEDVLRHLEHWAELVGPEHVGFGGDFDGITATLAGVETASAYPDLLRRLAERGFSDEDVRRIAGENWLRVLGRALAVGLGPPPGADNLVPSREAAP